MLRAALTAFAIVFIAELGDKTQLATMFLVAKGRSPLGVLLGSATALVCASVVGVLAGSVLFRYVPPQYMRLASGLGFMLIGLLLLTGKL